MHVDLDTRKAVGHLFPYLPKQPSYNERLRALVSQLTHLIAVLAADTDLWQHPVRIADSTPVQCGTSRETVKRSDLAGWASYGYCASHSRRFWGLRLHLVTTLHGLPVAFALTNPKVDERDVLIDLVSLQPNMFHHPAGLILVVDKGYRDRATETWLNDADIAVIRPSYRTETPRTAPAARRTAKHRVGQRHPQRPTRPRTTRRPHPRRRGRPRSATHPRHDRRDLAQLAHRPTHHAITHRLRPLTPWNGSSRTQAP